MGSGFDNSIYWIISHIVTTISYYTFATAVTMTKTIVTHKVFHSHVKSSQVFYELPVAVSYRELTELLV
jgi:hypothetical protein